MKLNKYILILITAIFFGLTSCSDDDKKEVIEAEEIPELKIDKNSIDVEIGKSSTIEIKGGGGEYRAFSANPDIVSVELNSQTIALKALKLGRTSVVISDKNSRYRELSVVAFYKEIILENNSVDDKIKLGNSKVIRIPIKQGNGGYKLVSANEDIVTAAVENQDIVLTLLTEGTTTVALEDSYGIKLDIPVKVETTTIPFTTEELDEIKADDTKRYNINGEDKNGYSWATQLNKIEDGKNLYGWDYYNYYYVKIYFAGDKTVGAKTDASIKHKTDWGASAVEEDVTLEIIKNDGSKIWGTYSYIKDNKLNYGHFCQDI